MGASDLHPAYFLTTLPMKKAQFLATIADRMRPWPLYSQEQPKASPWLVMKLFNAF
jgi:hypothetical protein